MYCIDLGNTTFENVIVNNYLGHIISLEKQIRSTDITRRIQFVCATFGKRSRLLQNNAIFLNLKRKVLNVRILRMVMYGMETFAIILTNVNRFLIMERTIEGSMLVSVWNIQLGIRKSGRERSSKM